MICSLDSKMVTFTPTDEPWKGGFRGSLFLRIRMGGGGGFQRLLLPGRTVSVLGVLVVILCFFIK